MRCTSACDAAMHNALSLATVCLRLRDEHAQANLMMSKRMSRDSFCMCIERHARGQLKVCAKAAFTALKQQAMQRHAGCVGERRAASCPDRSQLSRALLPTLTGSPSCSRPSATTRSVHLPWPPKWSDSSGSSAEHEIVKGCQCVRPRRGMQRKTHWPALCRRLPAGTETWTVVCAGWLAGASMMRSLTFLEAVMPARRRTHCLGWAKLQALARMEGSGMHNEQSSRVYTLVAGLQHLLSAQGLRRTQMEESSMQVTAKRSECARTHP